jgi:hypothetical protein
MQRSQKDLNRLPLWSALAANLVVYYGLVRGIDVSTLATSEAIKHISVLLPGGFAIALCGILNAQLTSIAKARIVFLKWNDPLPGSEAFSRHAPEDPRIDMASVEEEFGPLPTEPRAQNVLWYRLYQQVRDVPAVSQISKNWLFARDYACVIALLTPILGVIGILQMPSIRNYMMMAAFLLIQFPLASQAARNNARRLVATAIAQAITSQAQPVKSEQKPEKSSALKKLS